MNWLIVFVGGGLGSLVRYGISLVFKNNTWTFPVSTLISNVLASFIIGILTGTLSDEQKLLFATGFCGGFSTFSTFSNETLHLLQQGQVFLAVFNTALSIILCLLATFLGLKFFM
jgi:fluoride exporter